MKAFVAEQAVILHVFLHIILERILRNLFAKYGCVVYDIVSANEKQAAAQQTFVFRAPLTSNLPA
jgi:hypothetical protein